MAKTQAEVHDDVETKFVVSDEVRAVDNVVIRDTVTGLAMQYQALAHRMVDLTPVVKAQADAVDMLNGSYESAVTAIMKNQNKMGDVFNGVA